MEFLTSYTAMCFGPNGDSPGDVDVFIEDEFVLCSDVGCSDEDCPEDHLAYRWAEKESGEHGPWRSSEEEAEADGTAHAHEHDEIEDIDAAIDEILASEFFGPDADKDDIRRVIEAAESYDQGVLLLALGETPPSSIGLAWNTGNAYLERAHIAFACGDYAASRLRDAIEEEDY